MKDYPRLRTPHDFAKSLWTGKAAARDNMLKFAKKVGELLGWRNRGCLWILTQNLWQAIPNSLLTLETQGEVKQAISAFSTLLAYMGAKSKGKKAGSEKHLDVLLDLVRHRHARPRPRVVTLNRAAAGYPIVVHTLCRRALHAAHQAAHEHAAAV